MAPRRYSFGFAGQNFNFDLPEIGEGETEETRSVLASYFPELRLSYGAKTQRGGRLGRDVTPVQTEVTMAPTRQGGGATVNITGPTATQTITQAQPTEAAAAPAAYSGPDYTSYFQDILSALNPPKTEAPQQEPTPTTPESTPQTPALKQFTGDIGGISYKKIGGEGFGASDIQAALQGGYDPASVFGYAASLPKSQLGERVQQDLKAAGFTLSKQGAYGGTLPSAPTAAQTFLDTAVSKQLNKQTQKEVTAAATRAQGIPVAAASSTAQPTSIASPFTYVAPLKMAASAPTPAAPAFSFGGSASFSSSGGGKGGGGGGKGGGGGGKGGGKGK